MDIHGYVDLPADVNSFIHYCRENGVCLFDARAVMGREHLEVAYERSKRSFADGSNLSRDVCMETMLYLAGTRQIKTALQVAGVSEDTVAVAVIITTEEEPTLLKTLVRDDTVLAPSDSKLKHLYGSTYEHLGAQRYDIVFEKMCALEIEK